MNHKWILIFVLTLVMLPFTAWAEAAKSPNCASFERIETGESIFIGMTRFDAERIIGAPIADKTDAFDRVYYEGGLSLIFRDNAICAMFVRTDDLTPAEDETYSEILYRLYGGAALGMKIDEALALYDPFTLSVSPHNEISMAVVDGAWQYVRLEDMPDDAGPFETAFVALVPGFDVELGGIMMYDGYYAKYMK